MEEPRKLLNLAQAANYLGVAEHVLHNTFYRATKRTMPAPTYMGGRLYFHPDNFDEFALKGSKPLRSS
jgi:hypothetical protein